MTWLRLRERLGLITRKRPQPKLRKIFGLKSRRKRLEPRLSKRLGSGPSKRLGSGLSKRPGSGPSKRLKSRLSAETIEYSKKSLENGSAFVEKLRGAKSFQSAIYVRSEYAKTSYAELVAYLTKIGELNTKLAKEAFKRRSHVA
jgi:Phasin protein